MYDVYTLTKTYHEVEFKLTGKRNKWEKFLGFVEETELTYEPKITFLAISLTLFYIQYYITMFSVLNHRYYIFSSDVY